MPALPVETLWIDVLATKLKKLKTLSLPVATVPFAFLCQDPPFSLTEFRCPAPRSPVIKYPSRHSRRAAALPNLKTVMCNLPCSHHVPGHPRSGRNTLGINCCRVLSLTLSDAYDVKLLLTVPNLE